MKKANIVSAVFALFSCFMPGLLAAESDSLLLGDWYAAGPFKDERYGNILRSFEFVFAPEKDVLGVGDKAADLGKVYETAKFPAMLDIVRPWVKHSEWVDGYRHILPKGPAPSRNETMYLYRCISSKNDTNLTMRVYAEDFVGAWLNGRKVGQAIRNYGPNHYPVPLVVPVSLVKGENRLLVKITCMFGKHGFAFGLDGVTPSSTQLPLQWSSEIIRDKGSNFNSANMPYMSAEKRDVEVEPGVAAVSNAVRLVKNFKFDVTMMPMFDPPASKMDQMLKSEPVANDDGKQYADELAALGKQAGEARDGDAFVAVAKGIEKMWVGQIRKLGPIVFIRCPHFAVNAIAPYNAAGAEPASICVLDPLKPEESPRVVFHEPGTKIFDMNLSFDGKTIFFAAARKGVPGFWHIYEIGVDGSGLKQVTSGDCRDISPLPLPDGRIMFVSDRANTWVQCQGQKAGLLYTCNRDGSGVRKVSGNIDSDHAPAIMNDGRIMFTRWDYGIEKNVFARHALWTMNPDGTGFKLFAGNTKEDPAGFWEARRIPGRPEVVCTFGPHHNFHSGMIGLVWNKLGAEAPRGEGFRFITEEIPAYCDTTFPYGYQQAFPVNERQFLVSYGGDGGQKNRLYLLDDRGNRKCIYEAEGDLGCWRPMLMKPQPVPPVIQAQCANPEWAYEEPEVMNSSGSNMWATLMVQDVYQGLEPQVKRGDAKFIQVMEQVQKSRSMAGGEAWGHTPIISRGTVHVRRLVGLVPVESDGSAHFKVPALKSISLNVLNADGKCLMRMGSDMVVMPGERQSCIGCHENRYGGVSPSVAPKATIASRNEAVYPQQPDWGTKGIVDYQKVVQPVWDKYCTSCHRGSAPKGGIDLTGDRTRFFCMSYDNLVERDFVDFYAVFAGDHDENAPLTVGSMVSRLCELIDTPKHCEKQIPLEDRQKIYTWIDANIPYYGTYEYGKCKGIGARDSWEADNGNPKGRDGWLASVAWPVFEKRCLGCHQREIHNQGFWGWGGGPMDRKISVSSKIWTDRGATSHMFPERYYMSAKIGPELRINLTHPTDSSLLQAPLSKEAGGWGLCKGADGVPVFKDKNDADYKLMLTAIEVGKARLYAEPRVDMPAAHVAEIGKTVLQEEAIRKFESEIREGAVDLSKGLRIIKEIPGGLTNLVIGATASSPDGIDLDGAPPRVSEQGGIDGDQNTIWDEVDDQKLYRYRVDFGRQVSVSALRLSGWAHHDFAPKSFAILCDGKVIGRVKKVTYVNNILQLGFPRTMCRVFELVIDEYYGGSPAIRELECYDEGGVNK